ncbi:MAG TPA: 30S ribosome-binding factor RbfA [Bacilli bacterium]|nr:30S ribosome-binding factor RbfA [Bacilli bacterium]
MSIKSQRLASVFQQEISDILANEINDEDIKFVTITAVTITSDLSLAKIYCTVFNRSNIDKCLEDLNKAEGFIKSELCKRKIRMRKMPELEFLYDKSIDYGNRIEKLIEETKKEN